MHHEWHKLRHEVEVQWKQSEPLPEKGDPFGSVVDYYYGHCERRPGSAIAYKYVPMEFPKLVTADAA